VERIVPASTRRKIMLNATAVTFNILVKQEPEGFLAHCLELDIVATSETLEGVKKDMIDLIFAQVHYAFSNDNLEHLYHPAPPEVWKEFYECRERIQEHYRTPEEDTELEKFVPPWIIANTCRSSGSCHA
jgi:hypothetical protein